jgi:uncharacterized membrane protein
MGVAFMVGAGLIAELVAKACSSPQTAYLNAEKRADSLMFWVHIGLVEGILFIGIAAACDKQYRTAILAGGALEALITYGEYVYAKEAGLRNGGPTTEDW